METSQVVLNERARLRLTEGACLPLRSDFGQCRACESVCPVRVIRVSAEAVALDDGCLHCGRCVAACPTDALQLDGYAFSVPAAERTAPIEVECAKVPAAVRASDAVVIPCLGALSTGRLAQLHEAAGEHGVVLVDRGWCRGCSAGCGDGRHPAAAALEQVVLWLESINDPRPAPRWASRPLPQSQMPESIPLPPAPADQGPALTRRQFFRSVVEDPVGRRRNVTPMGGSGRAAFPASQRREAPDRRRLLDALDRAATRAGTALPDELFPRVVNNGACVDHRVCTAACPTGALKVVAIDGAASLTFSAVACIGCGACQRSCPEGALMVDIHGGGERAPAVIARHTQQTCSSCGEVFTPRAGEALCLACSKTQRFLGDAMAKLFGSASEAKT
jgi:ferredoxin